MKVVVQFTFPDGDKNTHKKLMNSIINIVGVKTKILCVLESGELTFDAIEKSVCDFVDITPELLQKKTRDRDIVEARQICHYLAKRHTNSILTVIGQRFGGKDHATVLYSNNTVKNLLHKDKEYRKKYQTFIESFKNETAKA